jgi:Fe-S-cluster-containing dehydrogenase component
MGKHVIQLKKSRCIGCYACELHCKTKNDLPVGPRNCRIIADNSKVVGDTPKTEFSFMPCFHCDTPWCVSVCPTGAMQKRGDGIVFVEDSLCIGCQFCITACPWGAPQWNAATKTVSKCDHCRDRVDQGLQPACVSKCTAHALQWIGSEE